MDSLAMPILKAMWLLIVQTPFQRNNKKLFEGWEMLLQANLEKGCVKNWHQSR
jgi:hypothetical protein